MMVRVLDSSKTNALGDKELDIRVGPNDFNILFVVTDIPPLFSLLTSLVHFTTRMPLDPHKRYYTFQLASENKIHLS